MLREKDTRPIGVFDSGVGGLTVLKGILRVLPDESYIYIGDTAHVPYGTKSPELVGELATDVARALIKQDVKAIVVACNTVSAVALPDIQSLSGDIPVIGVIDPTVRHAVSMENGSKIAVIATEVTINSGIYERKIREAGQHTGKHDLAVVSRATPAFVPLIEEQPHGNPLIHPAIQQYLSDFRDDPNLTTLILGCTHYPMIQKEIEEYLGRRITVVNSAEPTAVALQDLLEREHMLHGQNQPTRIFFTSDDPSKSMRIARDFLGGNLVLERLDIDGQHHY